MALDLQKKAVSLVVEILGAKLRMTPEWLIRPGKLECGVLWRLIQEVYADLQGGELPESAPSREWRHVDAVLTTSAGETFIMELDETQHFNRYRRMTLDRYPDGAELRFDRLVWMNRCDAKKRLEGGGWGEPKPPLFPGANGRHRQRAFRDALADLLPPLQGFGPTLRIAYFEVEDWIQAESAHDRMTALLRARGLLP